MRAGSFVSVLAFVFASSATALAAGMPADCSKGPVPAGPAKGVIDGAPFVPVSTELVTSSSVSQDGATLQDYALRFHKPEGGFDEAVAEVVVAVRGGKQVDGRTFHRVPGGTHVQPMAMEGWPEVQHWEFKDDASGADVESMFLEEGSLQVTFAKRAGGKIAGTIYMCAPGDKPSWIGGSFTADIGE